MIGRRYVLVIALTALLAGIAALFLYFWWPSPLIDGSRISSFTYGPLGVNLRELDVFTREDDEELLDEIIRLANEAPVGVSRLERRDGTPMVVLFREDGLQYVLIVGDDAHVGISEGDASYLGSLESPELSRLLTSLVSVP